MKFQVKFLVIFVLIICFCSTSFGESVLQRQEEEDTSGFSVKKLFEKTDSLIKGKGIKGSQLMKPKEGNYAFFKNAKFRLSGDYQLNSVYYNERDLNGFNGNRKKWDSDLAKEVRVQTNEVEAYLYHDLTLNPMIELADGMLMLHMELYNGGYMLEMDYTRNVYFSDEREGSLESIFDFRKIELRTLWFEAITPLGLVIGGKFPDNFLGLTGVGWGAPIPPVPGLMLALIYGVKNEGENKLATEHFEGVTYIDTQQNEDFQDQDDQSVYILYAKYDVGNLKSDTIYSHAFGGKRSKSSTDMNVPGIATTIKYNKENLHIYTTFGLTHGTFAPLTYNESGKDMISLRNGINNSVLGTPEKDPLLDIRNYHPCYYSVEDLGYNMAMKFFGMVSYDTGNYTPEVGFLYTSGSDNWYESHQGMSPSFEPEGNRNPRPYMKAYLLNEIEDKYFPLISNFSVQQAVRHSERLRYQNMTAIKVGTTRRLGEAFEAFGQVLAAWRSNTTYYEKDYWDTFSLTYAKANKELVNDANGEKTTRLPILFQTKSEDYYPEGGVDNFLGMELNGRITWFARTGFSISLIGAYFHAGGFYEDILTPKLYKGQTVNADAATGEFALVDEVPLVDVWGPNTSSDGNPFESVDAWTLQMKFEVKFQ